MNTPIDKYVVLTSGGDAPGMNAAIRAVVRSGIAAGATMYGAELGYKGLLKQELIPLSVESVANCIQRGGTILKSARCDDFFQPEVRQKVADFLNLQGITGLIVLGGNGSFQGALKLQQQGGPATVGIPCTIDNDINGTEYCIGFDTCCNTALQAIDKIRDTALSFDNNFLVEVMGRASGFIAATVGVAGGAELILTPEFPMTSDQIIESLTCKKRQKLASIIVAAESGTPGWTFSLAKEIKEKADLTYRVCILGHTQRGGSPTTKDRLIATRMGYHAIEVLKKGKSGQMICLNKGEIAHTKFPDSKNGTRFFDNQELLHINERISRS
jgi:6-phosphofructokinase 1